MIYQPSRMGRLNRRALLRQLHKLGMATRADLVKALGLSQPTTGKIVDELLAMGILEEIELIHSSDELWGRGRPGRQLRLNQSKRSLLAIQLGLHETKLACLALGVLEEDNWQHSFSFEFDDAQQPKIWEKQLRKMAKKIDCTSLTGVVLSVPGIVDEAKNKILFSPNLHWTEKANLAATVQQVCQLPVVLVQEERALALGHHQLHPECEDFLLVDFGDGVGGSAIIRGKPLENPLPINGEIGHTPVLGNQRRCGCGGVGCMETLVSLSGLLKSFSEAQSVKKSTWPALHKFINENGLPDWLAQTLDIAAMAIAGALNMIGLQRVIITGSLAELPSTVTDHLAKSVQRGSIWAKFGTVECIVAPRHRTAGMIAVGMDRLIVPDTYDDSLVFKPARSHFLTKVKMSSHSH